jgi:hypothetical protein
MTKMNTGNISENKFHSQHECGSQSAFSGAMSSYVSIYKKTAPSLERNSDGSLRELTSKFDPTRHVAPVVAHELNNILTIVQGYTDRLLLRHSKDHPELMPHLKLISEASKRAAAVVRAATPPNANETFRKPPNSRPATTTV